MPKDYTQESEDEMVFIVEELKTSYRLNLNKHYVIEVTASSIVLEEKILVCWLTGVILCTYSSDLI